ncbi:MAG: D-TA family PLP-dependent enzyme [Bacteroidia bacterium]|nr:D-TA family PLP-dependent enzyme [Bacteroidia bacterium]
MDTPALLVYPDRVQQNISQAIQIAGGVDQIRPHVKTHKMLNVARMQVESRISHFKCATIAEAEMMAKAGASDVLIAYQLSQPRIVQLKRLIQKFPSVAFSSLIDNLDSAIILSGKFTETTPAKIFLDIDVGHHRTGIPAGNRLDELIYQLKSLSSLEIKGLHVYDGHNTEASLHKRIALSDAAMKPVLPYLVQHPEWELVTGGSPSFGAHSLHNDRRCSPGTFVFWDHGYQQKYPEYGFEYAALLATRVISKLDDQTYCLDLGHKHVASEGAAPQIALFDTSTYEQVIHSEEHLVIKFEAAMNLKVGDMLYGVPRHICPTVALYDAASVISNHEVVDHWEVTARDLQLPKP